MEDGDGTTRQRGLERMAEVYGWPEVGDADDAFFGYTRDHLFAEIWNRPGLTDRDRRLLLIGLLVGRGMHDVIDLQVEAALTNDEITPEQLREIVILLTHYAGWPSGAKLNSQVEALIAKVRREP